MPYMNQSLKIKKRELAVTWRILRVLSAAAPPGRHRSLLPCARSRPGLATLPQGPYPLSAPNLVVPMISEEWTTHKLSLQKECLHLSIVRMPIQAEFGDLKCRPL